VLGATRIVLGVLASALHKRSPSAQTLSPWCPTQCVSPPPPPLSLSVCPSVSRRLSLGVCFSASVGVCLSVPLSPSLPPLSFPPSSLVFVSPARPPAILSSSIMHLDIHTTLHNTAQHYSY
jgi:hypothetical protein